MMNRFLVLILVLGATSVADQTFCSLVVNVLDPEGQEVPDAQVSLTERNGRVLTQQNERGGVRFCDLGLMPVTITVGPPNCNQVSVKEVPLEWGKTSVVRVIYDRRPCMLDFPPVAACRILFRFSGEQAKWLSGVVFDPPISGAVPQQSDGFGRILVRIAAGTELRTAAKREGYLQNDVRFTCTRDVMAAERLVRLQSIQ